MECPMCMDADAAIKVRGCKHSFCLACAKEWFTRNEVATCPMCRGPFKFKGIEAWVQERNERDPLFEEGLNIILASKRVYRWRMIPHNNEMVLWGVRISKIEKMKEFQEAYNNLGDYEFEDDEDFEFFVLQEDVSDLLKHGKRKYFNDPTVRWFTQYPHIF